MSRYMDVDKLHSQGWVAARYKNWEPTPLNDNFRLEVEVKPFTAFPSADVQEVKQGRWITKGQDIFCSVCGEESAYTFCGASKFSNYCPYCGAKMDKVIMSTHYTIFINDSLVGYIEADSQEEAVEYAKENWKIEAINMDEEYEDESH